MFLQPFSRARADTLLLTRHFKSHALDVGFFHGDGRAKTPDELMEYDVVLTTYRTLAADWRGKQVLQNIAWLRVTLDEGKLTNLGEANLHLNFIQKANME